MVILIHLLSIPVIICLLRPYMGCFAYYDMCVILEIITWVKNYFNA
jgi:hypothetical protein